MHIQSKRHGDDPPPSPTPAHLLVVRAERRGVSVPVRADVQRQEVALGIAKGLDLLHDMAADGGAARQVAAAVAVEVAERAPPQRTKGGRGVAVEPAHTIGKVLVAGAVREKVVLPDGKRNVVQRQGLCGDNVHHERDGGDACAAVQVLDFDELDADGRGAEGGVQGPLFWGWVGWRGGLLSVTRDWCVLCVCVCDMCEMCVMCVMCVMCAVCAV